MNSRTDGRFAPLMWIYTHNRCFPVGRVSTGPVTSGDEDAAAATIAGAVTRPGCRGKFRIRDRMRS